MLGLIVEPPLFVMVGRVEGLGELGGFVAAGALALELTMPESAAITVFG